MISKALKSIRSQINDWSFGETRKHSKKSGQELMKKMFGQDTLTYTQPTLFAGMAFGAGFHLTASLATSPQVEVNYGALQQARTDLADSFRKIADNKKPKATKEMWITIAALHSLQGKNLFRTEDGLYRSDALKMSMEFLAEQGYDISELTFWGSLPPQKTSSATPSKFPNNLFKNVKSDMEYGDPFEDLFYYSDKDLVMDILSTVSAYRKDILKDLISRGTLKGNRLYLTGGYEFVVSGGGMDLSTSDKNLAPFFGFSRHTFKKWRMRFYSSDSFNDQILAYRKIKHALFQLLNLKGSDATYARALQNVLSYYQHKYFSDLDFMDKFLFLCDKYMTSAFSGRELSKLLASHNNYISKDGFF